MAAYVSGDLWHTPVLKASGISNYIINQLLAYLGHPTLGAIQGFLSKEAPSRMVGIDKVFDNPFNQQCKLRGHARDCDRDHKGLICHCSVQHVGDLDKPGFYLS